MRSGPIICLLWKNHSTFLEIDHPNCYSVKLFSTSTFIWSTLMVQTTGMLFHVSHTATVGVHWPWCVCVNTRCHADDMADWGWNWRWWRCSELQWDKKFNEGDFPQDGNAPLSHKHTSEHGVTMRGMPLSFCWPGCRGNLSGEAGWSQDQV